MTDTQPEDEERTTRPFADVFLELNRGRPHAEASTKLQELVEAVMATGKKGSLQIVITIAKSKASGQVEVYDDVRVKTPPADRATSLFFVDDEANLTRTDPRQLELELRDVSADSSDRQLRKAD